MKHPERSSWFLTITACSAALSIGCSDAATTVPGSASGAGGGGGLGGAGGLAAGGSTAGGGGMAQAGTTAVAGPAGGGGLAGTSGIGGGAGTSGSGGSAGSGGTAGGGPTDMPYGVVSCQPAFEVECKPDIVFENGDPDGRGKVFTDVIPDVETTMKDIACVVCSMLYRSPDEIPQNKHPDTITLILDEHGGVAQAGGGTIQFDLNYINGYAGDDAETTRREMMGVLQHETVHLYQNYGNGGTGEGEADLVRVRMNYYEAYRWSSGGNWTDAYTTSGNFYSWLTGPCEFHSEHYSMNDLDFPYKLNAALAGTGGDDAYTAVDDLVQDLFGKTADELWSEYQSTAF
jgi:hypothetical protein